MTPEISMPQATATVSRDLMSPVGRLRLIADERALLSVQRLGDLQLHDVGHPTRSEVAGATDRSRVLELACAQVEAYFRGELRAFTVPVGEGGTAFQREVWAALCTIPFGEHRSYAWLAKEIGRPRAVRAVGAANGRNPLAIIVPCHRVIGSSGALTGYAGGLEMKRWLLAHEALDGFMTQGPALSGRGAEAL